MNNYLAKFAVNIDQYIITFIQRLETDFNLDPAQLRKIWDSIDRSKNSNQANNSSQRNTCQAELLSGQRKGQSCGKNVSNKSETGNYCAIHLKWETLEGSTITRKEDKVDGTIFLLNKHGRYQFGSTGLILASAEDKRIIGRQLETGSIDDLTEENIALCKLRRFKYIPNYSSSLQTDLESNDI